MGTGSRAAALYVRTKNLAAAHPTASTLTSVLASYWLLTVAMTYPALPRALTEAAGGVDVYSFMWLLWWAKRSVIDLYTSTANVSALYHPYGAQLPSLVADAHLMWTSLPLVTLLGPLVAYNAQFLSSYVRSSPIFPVKVAARVDSCGSFHRLRFG